MTRERLLELENLFHAVLAQDPASRARYLEESCGSDRDLLLSVQALLEAEPSTGRLRQLVESAAALPELATLIGRRVGAYEIQREIGEGGMGAVYLAIRADETYRKQVAVKFVKAGWTSSYILQRFQVERQILANLDHPYIARLLDGGTAFDGRPYLVMEYVNGLSITEFAARNGLDTKARVHLFRLICEAVQYAHQNLVVHRDLKPANIFITPEGTPKLLDFGIAKLLDVEPAAESTQAQGWRLLTPEYASPEQFRGERVTTAADIYSLGAILYVLLTGRAPYDFADKSSSEIERIVGAEDPPRPKTLNPLLCGRLGRDLDTLVLKAMRKAPQERYGSVGDLMADLDNALADLPLRARDYTFVERGLRLVHRHRAGVLAGALAAASLIAGTGIAVRAAARAERERARADVERLRAGQSALEAAREQARAEKNEKEAELRRIEAERERRRAEASLDIAEHRLQDEDRLATDVLFGINDSLRGVPGTTEVRSKAVQASAEYLDRLARESQNNFRLQLDLAKAYQRLAELTGSPVEANQGDLAGSLALYEKAKAILQRLLVQKPKDPVVRQQLATGQSYTVSVLAYLGRQREAQEEGTRAVTIFRGLVDETPGSTAALNDLAKCYLRMLSVSNKFNDRSQVIHFAALAREAFERLTAIDPQGLEPRLGLSDALAQESSARLFLSDVEGALAKSLQALRIRETLRLEFPTNRDVLEGLMLSYGRLGDIADQTASGATGPDYRLSLEYFQKANEIAGKLAGQDPANQRGQLNLAISTSRLGEAYSNLDRDEQALAACRESNRILEKLRAADARNVVTRMYTMVNSTRIAHHLNRLNRRDEAVEAYRTALQVSLPLIATDDGTGLATNTYVIARMGLALDAAQRGDRAAEQSVDQALSAMDKFAAAHPGQFTARMRPPVALARAGKIFETLAGNTADMGQRRIDLEKARHYYQRASAAWEQIPETMRMRAPKIERSILAESQVSLHQLASR